MLTLDAIKQSAYSLGIIPVIRIEDAALARPLAQALTAGGLPAAEVTFRTAAAPEAIAAMREAFPDMLICAGTVLTPQQADAAVSSGASFVVSPGLNPEVVTHCLEHDIPIIPGCATPSDIERALSLGLDTVKFFPAEANGGIAAIKAIAAPYGQVSFMPTGGINAGNLGSYLAFKKVLCCGGSFMVPGSALAAEDFTVITALTRQAVRAVHQLKLASLSLNGEEDSLSVLLGMDGRYPVFTTASLDRLKGYFTLTGIPFTPTGEDAILAVTGGQTVIIRQEEKE